MERQEKVRGNKKGRNGEEQREEMTERKRGR